MRALTLTQPWAGLVVSGIKLVENRPRAMIKHEDFGKPFAIHASREVDESVYARIVEIAPELAADLKVPLLMRWTKLAGINSAVIGLATIECAFRQWTIPRTGAVELRDDATGEVIDLGDQRRWYFGPIGYLLRDVRALAEPVPCRGFQGFWTLPDDVATRVRA